MELETSFFYQLKEFKSEKKTKTIYIIDLTLNTTFDPTILDYTQNFSTFINFKF